MLISKILEGEEIDESAEENFDNGDRSHEYHTAGVLSDMVSLDHIDMDDDSLTPGDLVVLYKSNDKGTKLMSNPNKFIRRKPNQYVETVIYNEEPESDGSDINDMYSSEELQSVLLVNKERIELLSGCQSLEKNLCQKFGSVDIQSSNLSTEYNKYLHFRDSYIKNNINSLHVSFGQFESSLLPVSLLDYICCKGLEDNYNFYMDNIITYVKHTIEQLTRISNGEYLTDRTKEKWKEVDSSERNKCTKILATSTSIPFHVEGKSNGHIKTWNELVHSEIDVRCLSKILERQIIIKVPKLICGTYKLFSKCFADNLIIRCKNGDARAIEDVKEEENASRVDFVFRLGKSQSGHMMGNINSVMVVQTPSNIMNNYTEALLPLPWKENENVEVTDKTVKITEICKYEENNPNTEASTIDDAAESKDSTYFGDYEETQCDSLVGSNDYPRSDNECDIFKNQSYSESSQSIDLFRNSLNNEPLHQGESIYNIVSSDQMRLTGERFNMNMCLPEESEEDISLCTKNVTKKKSPTRVRIKSPYENRSYIIEEKKRKRLLEIRERREKKKQAFSESCKISKHKYPKGVAIPQPSSSVTKLSITNKSFYNSIYGQATAIKNNQEKVKGIKKDSIPEVPIDEVCTGDESLSLNVENDDEKFINNYYYLDDAETEVMRAKMRKEDNCEMQDCSASASMVSNDIGDNLKLLSQILDPSVINQHKEDITLHNEVQLIDDKNYIQTRDNDYTPPNVENKVPANSLTNVFSDNKINLKKTTSSIKCRKSIDKIYSLINKEGNNINDEKLPPKNKSLVPLDVIEDRRSSTIQGSDSGTSVKHHLTSSNPSYLSFGKTNEVKSKMSAVKKPQTPIVPKVIISTKSQCLKSDIERPKKIKKAPFNALKSEENPLKAISQLLHNIDNVQKIRHRVVEPKNIKKLEPVLNDINNSSRQGTARRHFRFDQNLKDSQFPEKNTVIMSQPRKPKSIFDISKIQHQPTSNEKDKINERLIIDIIDEAKEARGEAVRGPPKFYSRLNSLAQPKKSYVQAHSEEYHTRYGKNLMAERLQRLAKTQATFLERKARSANAKIRLKKNGSEMTSPVSAKPAPTSTPAASARRPASISTKEKPLKSILQFKNTPEKLETLKKMVHVEKPYTKDHYGHTSFLSGSNDGLPLDHISRAPLLPNDADIISITSTNTVEESYELGKKLHSIIDTMVNANTSALASSSESIEINSKNTEKISLVDSLSTGKEHVSEEFDFPIDDFKNRNMITAAAENNGKTIEINKDSTDCAKPEIHDFTTELSKLENALYRQIPVGTFQKRLRINNFKLTPKQSVKAPFSLQSGDAGSVLLKDPLSQNFTKFCRDNLADIKAFPVLSKSNLDWGSVQFPMQIATIGYAFAEYPMAKVNPNLKLKRLLEEVKDSSKLTNIKVVSVQCSDTTISPYNEQPEVKNENAVQVDVEEKSAIGKNIPKNNIINKNKAANIDEITKAVFEPKAESVQLVSDGEIKPSKKINDMSIDYTTSLDMLVGLLNEIQKITTCQTHITNVNRNTQQCKELNDIINDPTTLEKYSYKNSREIISITSRDKLRHLESTPSIYTFYLTSDEEHENYVNKSKDNNYRPIYEDKEVYTNLHERETVNMFTDVPSIFPITINHSTNVTNSLIGVLSEPSSQSLFPSYFEYNSINSDNFVNPQKMVIELSRPMTNDKWSRQSLVSSYKNLQLRNASNFSVFTTTDAKREKNPQEYIENLYKDICYKNHRNHDFNSSIKMKRDILVTVYSILVFTVFAALSFPELMYRA